MSDSCNHDCSSCGESCSDRFDPQSLLAETNPYSEVKKVIGVVSGKGGVGKSLVTSLLATMAQRNGKQSAIIDADITGPSIPAVFGVHDKVYADERGIIPAETKNGTKIMSVNLFLDDETDPVVWRGPIIAGQVKQFWSDVVWGEVDYLFVDMPPGTGDVPLTVFQSLPIDGIIIVTSPQELVHMIVEKAAKMASMMDVPILGIVENMSYFTCPDCNKKHYIYGQTDIEHLAKSFEIPASASIPIDPLIAAKCDAGEIEDLQAPWMDALSQMLK